VCTAYGNQKNMRMAPDGFGGALIVWDNYRFQLRGERKINPVIQIVFIRDESTKVLGKWPWRRRYHAALIHALSKYEPMAIAYDVLFTEPASDFPEDDRFLANATKEAGNVYYPLLLYYERREKRRR